MKGRNQSIFVLVSLFLMGGLGTLMEVEACDSQMVFTLDLIQNTGANILDDPVGVAKAFKGFVCVTPCTEIKQNIQVSKMAFELAMIDIQLLLLQTETDLGVIFIEHLTNTNPILATSLILVVDSFIQGIIKLEYFICDASMFVNAALDKAAVAIDDRVSEDKQTIMALENCADNHHVYLKEDISTQYDVCVRKVMNSFTVDFNTYLGHMAKYKFYGPDLAAELGDCLLKCDSNLDLPVALDTARCLGFGEELRLRQLYEINDQLLVETVTVISKLQNSVTNVQKCGRYYVDKLYETIASENVFCVIDDSC